MAKMDMSILSSIKIRDTKKQKSFGLSANVWARLLTAKPGKIHVRPVGKL